MKKPMIILFMAFLLAGGLAFSPRVVQADLEWRVIKELDLKTTPLDVTPSADGQVLFILTPGEIWVYSLQEGKITDRIPVDKDFDRVVSLPKGNTLSISSSTKKTLQFISLETLYKIDVSGLPFRGSQDALVTLVVFDDYQ